MAGMRCQCMSGRARICVSNQDAGLSQIWQGNHRENNKKYNWDLNLSQQLLTPPQAHLLPFFGLSTELVLCEDMRVRGGVRTLLQALGHELGLPLGAMGL